MFPAMCSVRPDTFSAGRTRRKSRLNSCNPHALNVGMFSPLWADLGLPLHSQNGADAPNGAKFSVFAEIQTIFDCARHVFPSLR
jgi:hypothetical protein